MVELIVTTGVFVAKVTAVVLMCSVCIAMYMAEAQHIGEEA